MVVSLSPSADQSALQLRAVPDVQVLLQAGFCKPTATELLPRSHRTAADHCCLSKTHENTVTGTASNALLNLSDF